MHEFELPEPRPVSAGQIEAYERDGFVRLKNVLSPELLADYLVEITRVVRAWTVGSFVEQVRRDSGAEVAEKLIKHLRKEAPSTNRSPSTYERAFTQRMNLWRRSETIAGLVQSKRLAQLAADLMGVEGVRLYHDQALFKEAQGGHTPWHADQFYWPLSSDQMITLWIPLQAVSQNMGPLCFAPGSQLAMKDIASQLSISDDSERILGEKWPLVEEVPFEAGEVSFHAGWTCHRAGPNTTDSTRAAFTIIYMDKDIRLIEPQHPNHVADARMWLPGVQPGEVAASAINPVLFSRRMVS